jgi:hypothetical protein
VQSELHISIFAVNTSPLPSYYIRDYLLKRHVKLPSPRRHSPFHKRFGARIFGRRNSGVHIDPPGNRVLHQRMLLLVPNHRWAQRPAYVVPPCREPTGVHRVVPGRNELRRRPSVRRHRRRIPLGRLRTQCTRITRPPLYKLRHHTLRFKVTQQLVLAAANDTRDLLQQTLFDGAGNVCGCGDEFMLDTLEESAAEGAG